MDVAGGDPTGRVSFEGDTTLPLLPLLPLPPVGEVLSLDFPRKPPVSGGGEDCRVVEEREGGVLEFVGVRVSVCVGADGI